MWSLSFAPVLIFEWDLPCSVQMFYLLHVDRSRLAAKYLHVRFVHRWQERALFVFVVCDCRAEVLTVCKDSKTSWVSFYVDFLTRFHLQICMFLPWPRGSPTVGWSPGRFSLTCGFNPKQSSFDVVAWIWMRTWWFQPSCLQMSVYANQLQTSSSTAWGGGPPSLTQANNAAGFTLAVHPTSSLMKASQPSFSATWTLDPAHMWQRHQQVIKRNEWRWSPSFSSKLNETDSSD